MNYYYVYIITNYNQTAFYTYELHNDINEAISREKLIKRWKRAWKVYLIKRVNPKFIDLYNNGNILPINA